MRRSPSGIGTRYRLQTLTKTKTVQLHTQTIDVTEADVATPLGSINDVGGADSTTRSGGCSRALLRSVVIGKSLSNDESRKADLAVMKRRSRCPAAVLLLVALTNAQGQQSAPPVTPPPATAPSSTTPTSANAAQTTPSTPNAPKPAPEPNRGVVEESADVGGAIGEGAGRLAGMLAGLSIKGAVALTKVAKRAVR